MRDLWLLPAGFIAGICNAIAGGGSLLTFPVFLALGYPPYIANVTNAVGIFTSNIGAVWGYRTQLRTEPRLVAVLGAAGVLGAVVGSVLLLQTGETAFEALVPFLVAAGALLVLVQPRLVAVVQRSATTAGAHARIAVVVTSVVCIYGGYFGAAMGVMLLGVFGALLHRPLQQLNAYKNAVALCVNATCLVLFALFAPVAWAAAGWMSIGTVLGGLVGARVAKRLSDRYLRLCIVALGLGAAVMVALQ